MILCIYTPDDMSVVNTYYIQIHHDSVVYRRAKVKQ